MHMAQLAITEDMTAKKSNFICLIPIYNNAFALKEIITSYVNLSISKNVLMIWNTTRTSINKAMFFLLSRFHF